MKKQRSVVVFLSLVLAFLFAACAPTVPQDEYDQVVSDLASSEQEVDQLQEGLRDSQARIVELESQVDTLETELADLETQKSAAESELVDLQERVAKAAASAEIMQTFLEVGFGGQELSEADAMTVFQDLSSMVETSGDEELEAKFQAMLLSFGGEEEALELVRYMLGTITSLDEE